MSYIIKNKILIFSTILFAFFTLWRIQIGTPVTDEEQSTLMIWSGSYQLLAIIGGVWGLRVAIKWGGFRSLFGRVLSFFALGLFAQSFGQSYYSAIYYLGREAVYPSLGDVGYFGSVLLYIYAAYLLIKVCYIKISVTKKIDLLKVLSIPSLLLALSYWVFLRDYEFDFSAPVKIFLDFGYPFGQAIYVSLALIVIIFSRKILGGLMKKPTIFLLLALIMQYISDYSFLYLSSRGWWVAGGINDYMYLVSYYLMTVALVNIGSALQVRSNK